MACILLELETDDLDGLEGIKMMKIFGFFEGFQRFLGLRCVNRFSVVLKRFREGFDGIWLLLSTCLVRRTLFAFGRFDEEGFRIFWILFLVFGKDRRALNEGGELELDLGRNKSLLRLRGLEILGISFM